MKTQFKKMKEEIDRLKAEEKSWNAANQTRIDQLNRAEQIHKEELKKKDGLIEAEEDRTMKAHI